MSAAYNIIDEHKVLLKSRGYDEESLNSPDKPGTLFKNLSQHVGLAIHENLIDKDAQEFDLKAIGFFKSDTEMAFFKFKYLFDVENLSLNLTELIVRMDGVEKTFSFKSNYELPKSEEVLNQVRQNIIAQKKGKGTPRIVGDNFQKGKTI